MEGINILVASRHDKDREGILTALSLQKDFIITGVEKDEVGTIIKSEQLKPNVLIIDLHPSNLDELELAAIIRRKTPSTSIVLICCKNIDKDKAFTAGIRGFLLKHDTDEIISAVNTANRGSCYISGQYIQYSANEISRLKLPELSLSLSPAERGIVTHIAKGLSDDEIARHLNYSTGTIRNILTAIKRKTNLKNRIQIVLFLLVYGVINLEVKDILKANKDRKSP